MMILQNPSLRLSVLPFTIFANNIANGICVALPVYVVLKLASGKIKEMPKIMYVLLGVCVLYFYSIIK